MHAKREYRAQLFWSSSKVKSALLKEAAIEPFAANLESVMSSPT
jgi:hypothetical protein